MRKIDFETKNKRCCHKSVKWKNKRIRDIYHGMMYRCFRKDCKSYKDYGLKGIIVCNDWVLNPNDFEEWAISNGYRDNLTIDRLDAHGNYCPENCRWIPLKENSRNKSTTRYINCNGIILSGRQWSKYLGRGTNYVNKLVAKYGIEYTREYINLELKNKNGKVA